MTSIQHSWTHMKNTLFLHTPHHTHFIYMENICIHLIQYLTYKFRAQIRVCIIQRSKKIREPNIYLHTLEKGHESPPIFFSHQHLTNLQQHNSKLFTTHQNHGTTIIKFVGANRLQYSQWTLILICMEHLDSHNMSLALSVDPRESTYHSRKSQF